MQETNLKKVHIFPSEEVYEANKGSVGAEDIAFVPAASEGLPLSGGTMTGPLYLSADPTQEMEAVTKRYVETLINQFSKTMHGIYTGTGSHGANGPNRLVSSFPMKAVLIEEKTSMRRLGIILKNGPVIVVEESSLTRNLKGVTWDPNGYYIEWFVYTGTADEQLNKSGEEYTYVILG